MSIEDAVKSLVPSATPEQCAEVAKAAVIELPAGPVTTDTYDPAHVPAAVDVLKDAIDTLDRVADVVAALAPGTPAGIAAGFVVLELPILGNLIEKVIAAIETK